MEHTVRCEGSTLLRHLAEAQSRPNRHGECIQQIHNLIAKRDDRQKGEKGFAGIPRESLVVTAALRACCSSISASFADSPTEAPQGRFTDVGLHARGLPRNTCWPSLREIMQLVCKVVVSYFFRVFGTIT